MLTQIRKIRRSCALRSEFRRLPDRVGKVFEVWFAILGRVMAMDGNRRLRLCNRCQRGIAHGHAAARTDAEWRTLVRFFLFMLSLLNVSGWVHSLWRSENILTRLSQQKENIEDEHERDRLHLRVASEPSRIDCRSAGTGSGLKNQTLAPPVFPLG